MFRPFQSGGRRHSRLSLQVRREHVFQDSFQQLRFLNRDELMRPFSIKFVGEEGVDAGGVTREWYSVLCRQMFSPLYALFVKSPDTQSYQPTPYFDDADADDSYRFAGRVVGKALLDGQLLDIHFTRSFYKHMLGIPLTYHVSTRRVRHCSGTRT